ncbi:hypothetical protein IJG72_04410 [bacterium]|nr:hypothetical protein [bacterium]
MTIGSLLTTGLAKSVGVAGVATVLYDVHKTGQLESGAKRRNAIAESALDTYLDTSQLNGTRYSMNRMQNFVLGKELKGNIFNGTREFYNSTLGYMQGVAQSLAFNVIPLGLSCVALIKKGALSKLSALGLAIYGGIDIAKNAFGLGQTHRLSKKD